MKIEIQIVDFYDDGDFDLYISGAYIDYIDFRNGEIELGNRQRLKSWKHLRLYVRGRKLMKESLK